MMRKLIEDSFNKALKDLIIKANDELKRFEFIDYCKQYVSKEKFERLNFMWLRGLLSDKENLVKEFLEFVHKEQDKS